jgi:hypothetical protein
MQILNFTNKICDSIINILFSIHIQKWNKMRGVQNENSKKKIQTKSFTNIFYEPIINFLFSINMDEADRRGRYLRRGVGSRHGQGGGRNIVWGG